MLQPKGGLCSVRASYCPCNPVVALMRLFPRPPCLQPGAYRFTVGMQDIHASLEADGEQLLGWLAGLHTPT